MKSLSLWQNTEEDKEKGGGEEQEHHQYITHCQTLHTWQHPEHQKFCIAIKIFSCVYVEQQMYRRTAVLISESPAAVNDKEMDDLIKEHKKKRFYRLLQLLAYFGYCISRPVLTLLL